MPKPRGENIRDIRVRRGEKRSALAARVGISYKHLYGIERGYPENPPSIEVLHRIATALDVDVAEVMADEPNEDDAERERRSANPTTHPEPTRPEPPPNPTRGPARVAITEPGAA